MYGVLLVSPAATPAAAVLPRVGRAIAAGLVFGLLLGVAAAWLPRPAAGRVTAEPADGNRRSTGRSPTCRRARPDGPGRRRGLALPRLGGGPLRRLPGRRGRLRLDRRRRSGPGRHRLLGGGAVGLLRPLGRRREPHGLRRRRGRAVDAGPRRARHPARRSGRDPSGSGSPARRAGAARPRPSPSPSACRCSWWSSTPTSPTS